MSAQGFVCQGCVCLPRGCLPMGLHAGGGVCPGEVSAQEGCVCLPGGGGVCPGGCTPPLPPVNTMTDRQV